MSFTDRLDAVPLPKGFTSPPPPQIKQEPREVPRIIGRIVTISGGITGGGDSENSRKNYARREVYPLIKHLTLDAK
ncbi:hypothetical protein LIER_14866 [Lithospermum erythrorhizon]|uniref:Uncharacterized protein n=1 Tax=Lithospermum erythrorhizon TaxID=34254 RepID=A0AAV3Q0P0_LITER